MSLGMDYNYRIHFTTLNPGNTQKTHNTSHFAHNTSSPELPRSPKSEAAGLNKNRAKLTTWVLKNEEKKFQNRTPASRFGLF